MYFVIQCSEDGDVSVIEYEKDELLSLINAEDCGDGSFFDTMPESDLQYWKNKTLIIKGDIVSPKPVKVVKEYEI